MIAKKLPGQGAKPTEGGAMPIVRAIMRRNPAPMEQVNMTAINNAAASLAAIATATPVEALAAFAGTDDLTVASMATDAAKAMAVCLNDADNTVAASAKSYGQARAILQFARNHAAESIDANDKRAIGFDDLPATASAKRRLSQWHSRFRLIAERRNRPADASADDKRFVSDEQLAGLYAGTVSFLTVYDQLSKAISAAKREADKAAKATEAAATVAATEAEPLTLRGMVEALATAYADATDEAKADAGEAFAFLIDLINADGGIAVAVADDQPEAIAA